MRACPAGVVLREQAADAGQPGAAHALGDLHQLVHGCRATPTQLAARRQGTGLGRSTLTIKIHVLHACPASGAGVRLISTLEQGCAAPWPHDHVK